MDNIVTKELVLKIKNIVIDLSNNNNPENEDELISNGIAEVGNLIAQEIIAKVVKQTIEEVLKNCTIRTDDGSWLNINPNTRNKG
jgi:hypothetical protein